MLEDALVHIILRNAGHIVIPVEGVGSVLSSEKIVRIQHVLLKVVVEATLCQWFGRASARKGGSQGDESCDASEGHDGSDPRDVSGDCVNAGVLKLMGEDYLQMRRGMWYIDIYIYVR